MKTYRGEGVPGLYSGLGISLFGVVIFKALYMGGYDSLKHSFHLEEKSVMLRYFAAQVRPSHSLPAPVTLTLPEQAVTTTVGTLCYPIDTIKRRLMIQQGLSSSSSSSGVQRRYRNSLDCLVKILREEGARGLFSGLSVNIVRGVSGALLLVGYDEMKKLLKDR